MSAAVEQAGARAVADLADGIVAAAGTLDGAVEAARIDGGVRLSAPGLARRWLTDGQLRGLALSVARAR